jgi:transposase
MEEKRRIYRREGDGYPSDLRDVEWARLAPLIPPALPGGRPRTDMRAAMNAILYLLRTGCPWRYLPRDSFPPRSTSTISFASSSAMGSGRRSGPSCIGIARAKDFENLTETFCTFVTLAAIQLALMRLVRA